MAARSGREGSSLIDLAIVNGAIVDPPQGGYDPAPRLGTVIVREGRIGGILEAGTPVEAAQTLDASGMLVFPGPIDIHFHCRAPLPPGHPTFASETKAAAAGGVTTVFEMPIARPCASTRDVWLARRRLAERESYVNVGLYGAPGLLNGEEINGMADAGAIAFKLFMTSAPMGREDEFHGLIADSLASVAEALRLIQPTGLRCVFHAEEQSLLNYYSMHAESLLGPEFRRHGHSRPPLVEATAIASLIVLSKQLDVPIHIAHVSSKAGADLIDYAHSIGAQVTAETCPHYLLFTEDVLEQIGPYGKINPPIRTAADRDALRDAVRRGVIDVIATDHAPALPSAKEATWNRILAAPAGHPGVEVLVPAVLTLALEGEFSLPRAVELLCLGPATIFKLFPRKGVIRPGADADLLVYDPRPVSRIDGSRWLTHAAKSNRLYDQMPVRGEVHATIVGGKVVFQSGEVIGQPGDGRIVRPIRDRITSVDPNLRLPGAEA